VEGSGTHILPRKDLLYWYTREPADLADLEEMKMEVTQEIVLLSQQITGIQDAFHNWGKTTMVIEHYQ
jgi:hypothetical protein